MNVRLITQEEISTRQQFLRSSYLAAQNGFTVSGFRRLMGSTFIAIGHKIHGRCEQRRLERVRENPLKVARGI